MGRRGGPRGGAPEGPASSCEPAGGIEAAPREGGVGSNPALFGGQGASAPGPRGGGGGGSPSTSIFTHWCVSPNPCVALVRCAGFGARLLYHILVMAEGFFQLIGKGGGGGVLGRICPTSLLSLLLSTLIHKMYSVGVQIRFQFVCSGHPRTRGLVTRNC